MEKARRKAVRRAQMTEQIDGLEELVVREIGDALTMPDEDSRRRKNDAAASLLLMTRLRFYLDNDRGGYAEPGNNNAQLIEAAEKQAEAIRRRLKLLS